VNHRAAKGVSPNHPKGVIVDIPFGKVYLAGLYVRESQKINDLNLELVKDSQGHFPLLGTSLSTLYQLGTCHGKCRGGDHILESLVGRTHNLGAAAFTLILSSYYDEALCLIRSIGEIANLFMLFAVNPAKYAEWVQATHDQHINDFSPSAVRYMIRDRKLVPMPGSWYAELCSKATHVTPHTAPNLHNNEGKRYVGGVPQHNGFHDCIDQLTEIVTNIAMTSGKILGREDLMKTVIEELRNFKEP
jgi:hypothetical protein